MNSTIRRIIFKSYLRYGDTISYRCRTDYIPRRFADKNFEDFMPRDREQLYLMQQHREKIKKKSKKYVLSTMSLQVLGSGGRGAPTTLYVSTDHSKYLFNCGEGTQRLAHEHHLKLSKLEHIFLTTPTWKNIGGLPGMALTIQENGVPNIKIHGPPGCSDLFASFKRFVVLKDLTVKDAACSADEPYVDSTMSVRYVLLTNDESDSSSDSESEPLTLDEVNYYDYETKANGRKSPPQERSKRQSVREKSLVGGKKISGAMAYICKVHPKAGVLLLDKCVDAGVPPGPLLRDLKAGDDVTLEDGTVVLSSEVTSPKQPGPVFIVLECPSEGYLDSLTNSEAFAKHQAAVSEPDDAASCIVHFTPERVFSNPRYREWMEKFPATTRHIVINEENRCYGSEAVHRIQHKLHLLHPDIFPLLDEEGVVVVKERSKAEANEGVEEFYDEREKIDDDSTKAVEAEVSSIQTEFPLVHRARTLDVMHLRPNLGFRSNNRIAITPRDYIDETFAVDGFLDALAELQTEISAQTRRQTNEAEYPKLVILGTGSCIPNKTRNTSGILLWLDEDRSIILDCGEGTAGQLIRFYGRNNVDKIFATIKAIYVSHLHADHHIGLIGLLQERGRVTSEPVVLLAPEQISSWLRIYHKRFEPIANHYCLIPNGNLVNNSPIAVYGQTQLEQALEGIQIRTVLVRHCLHAFGVSITLKNGYKIVYSGDTMPCDSLVELGADCDLLIHEATMADELVDEARIKLHSTISQAIETGARMRAKFVLLTHFSQRYSKIPHLPSNGDATPDLSRVGIAYDNMQVSASQLDILPLLYPGLKLMFSEFCNLLELKSRKRQMRIDREREAGLLGNDGNNSAKLLKSAQIE